MQQFRTDSLGAVGCGIVYLVNPAVAFVLVLRNQISLMICSISVQELCHCPGAAALPHVLG